MITTKEKLERTKQDIANSPEIRNVWELFAAILYRFGLGAGAIAALVVVLAYGTSIVWEDRAKTHQELKETNEKLIVHLIQSSVQSVEITSKMTQALADSNSAAIQNARANEQLSVAIHELTNEIRRER